MADISKITLPDNVIYDIKDSTARTQIGNMSSKLIYPVIGTQTAVTEHFTGSIDLDELYDGLTIAYYLPYAGSSTSATLDLTLPDGTSTGAIDVYETGTTRLTTQYAAGSTIILTYWSAGSISVSGTATSTARWTHADYDSNSIGYFLRHGSGTYTAYADTYRYMLLFSKSPTQALPVNSVSNSVATTKTLTTESFNPFGEILYYSATSTIATGSQITATALWQQYAFDLRYSFNCGQTLTPDKDVYIVAIPQSDGYAKLASSPLAQDLPTTEDGKIYIYLGHAYSNYQIEMHMNHPVYWYKDGKICLFSQKDALDTYDVYGAGSLLENGTNLNNLQTPGKYYSPSGASSATMVNTPYTAYGFFLYVETRDTRVIQTLWSVTTNESVMYRRIYTGTAWRDWFEWRDAEYIQNTTKTKLLGVGDTIASNTDLNDYTEIGVYSCGASTAATLTNCPVTTGLRMEVVHVAFTTRRQQRIFPQDPSIGVFYIRTEGANGFGSWFKFQGATV